MNIVLGSNYFLPVDYILNFIEEGLFILLILKNIQSGLYFETQIVNGKKKTKLKVKMYFIQLGVWILVVFMVNDY